MEKVKIATLLLFFLVSLQTIGQEPSKRQIRNLLKYDIDYYSLIERNDEFKTDLNNLIKWEIKWKEDKLSSRLIGGLGLGTASYGLLLIHFGKVNEDPNGRGEGSAYQNLIGGFFVFLGSVELMTSLGLHLSSKKKREKRDQYLNKIKSM